MKATLVVLAAGIGNRYGGNKHIAAVGPHREALLDYAVHDAIDAGFAKVVFVIGPEGRSEFRSRVSHGFDHAIEVRFAVQDSALILNEKSYGAERSKPWGTGHALICARPQVQEPFLVINADDFYGAATFRIAYQALTSREGSEGDYFVVGYRLVDTLSPHGSVSRGVCRAGVDGFLEQIEEHTEIRRSGHEIVALNRDGNPVTLPPDTPVSTNCWGFTPDVFDKISGFFEAFLRRYRHDAKREFFLPDAVSDLTRSAIARVQLYPSASPGFGITYPEDRAQVRRKLQKMADQGVYPKPVWKPPIADEVRGLPGKFPLAGQLVAARPFGSGLIHDTYLATYADGETTRRYIHQKINDRVFADPRSLMSNIERVTDHLRTKVDDEGKVLTLVHAADGEPLYLDAEGQQWRTFLFIEGSESSDRVRSANQARRAAAAFGRFQGQLIDLPGPRLNETIPGFHDTPKRFAALERAARADRHQRLDGCRPELEFALDRESLGHALMPLLASGSLPERVVHNDTKINNVLFDQQTGRALCIVDLDTVMPGTVLWDFGDLVRTATLCGAEDGCDPGRVTMDLQVFEALTRGYLSTAGTWLTAVEKEHLSMAGELMSFEVGIRFLTDYLEGDRYFKTRRPQQNLRRCRVQFALLGQMERHRDGMSAVVESLRT